MAVIINTNMAALTARKNLEVSQAHLATSIARLSSGLRITRAADDAAGLAISENLGAQVRGLGQASRNAANGISVVATAEGALNEIGNLLSRMRELAVQSSSGDLDTTGRSNLNSEYTQLLAEIKRISDSTTFNGTSLLSGASTATFNFQIGINSGSNNILTVTISAADTTVIGGVTGSAISQTVISDRVSAMSSLQNIDSAISTVSSIRGTLGAMQNRLESIIRNLAVSIENTTAANSRIRDVDVAEETAAYTKNQILVQAGVSVLAQANQQPAMALSLLGGR
ncbi:MAG: flagellin FliC [Deltaproteobacteria bacterium]|nr:flagellin FliC [Deltaproteobacteria bacterium]